MNAAVVSALKRRDWPPYVAGALIGVLSWFAFATADHPLGVSDAFVRTVRLLARAVGLATGPDAGHIPIDWGLVLVVGIFLGALTSARLTGSRDTGTVPALWQRRFGTSRLLRFGAAFVGGALVMFGARLAGGCTIGHGISGTLELAVSGWTFLAAVCVAGVSAAHVIYGRERRHV